MEGLPEINEGDLKLPLIWHDTFRDGKAVRTCMIPYSRVQFVQCVDFLAYQEYENFLGLCKDLKWEQNFITEGLGLRLHV